MLWWLVWALIRWGKKKKCLLLLPLELKTLSSRRNALFLLCSFFVKMFNIRVDYGLLSSVHKYMGSEFPSAASCIFFLKESQEHYRYDIIVCLLHTSVFGGRSWEAGWRISQCFGNQNL